MGYDVDAYKAVLIVCLDAADILDMNRMFTRKKPNDYLIVILYERSHPV